MVWVIGYEKSLGSDHPSTLRTINSSANLLSKQGNLGEAKALYDESSPK